MSICFKRLLIIVTFFSLITLQAQHEWVRTNPGGGGAISMVGATADGTLVAASDLSGIYTSNDNGSTWQVFGATQGLTQTAISSLGFHPTDGKTFIIGTGIGAFKTTNGGNTINQVQIELGQNGIGFVESIGMAISNASVGYMAHYEDWLLPLSFLKTTDAGDTWKKITTSGIPPETRITKILVDKNNENLVYALAGKARFACSDPFLYRSTNGGANWTRIATQFSAIFDFDLHPSDPKTVYVSTFVANALGCDPNVEMWQYIADSGKTYKSTNAGVGFEEIFNIGGVISVGDNPNNISVVDIINTDSTDADSGTYKTTNGGTNWSHTGPLRNWFKGWSDDNFSYALSLYGIAKTLTKDRLNSNRLYGSFGQWAWSSIDGGDHINNVSTKDLNNGNFLSTGLENIEGNTIDVNDADPNTVYMGGYDIGFWYSKNHGASWKRSLPDTNTYPDHVWYAGGGSNTNFVLSDPEMPNVVWASFSANQPSTKSAIFKSTEFGENWSLSNNGLNRLGANTHGLSLDVNSPSANRTLYVTQEGDVFKSSDGGANWIKIFTNGGLKFTEVDKFDPQLLYAGGENGFWRSTDGGANWAEVGLPEMRFTTTVPNAVKRTDIVPTFGDQYSNPPIVAWEGVFEIKADPNIANRLYVIAYGAGKGLYRSDDAGITWQKLYDNDKMRGVAIAQQNSDIVYTSSSLNYHSGGFDNRSKGILVSYDAGQTWASANQGMAWTNGGRMEIETGTTPHIWAWSPGTGVQHSLIPNFNGNESPPVANAGEDKTITLPTSSSTLSGTGNDPDGGDVSYSWSQQSGPNTATLSGNNTANLSASNLAEGSYVFRLTVTDDEDETAFDETSVTVLSEPDTGDFALRINTGGSTTTFQGNQYIADNHFNTGRTLNRPQTGLLEPYKTFRYSRSRTMAYDIPLQDGEYVVKLHFAELWFGATGGGAGGVGSRVFDVNIEGQLVEDNLDVFALAGANSPLVRTHTITVTGGNLDIDFSSLDAVGGKRHPIINAIEIIGGEQSTVPPIANAGSDKTITLPTSSTTLSGTGNDPDGGDVSYSWSQESGPNTATLSGNNTANLSASNLAEGSYVFRLTVTDDEDETAFDETSVTVLSEPDTEDFALRINTGGSQAMYNGNEFIADAHFNTGNTLNRPQTGLSEPYKTFRYSRSKTMAYDIPLEDGEYQVKLHFAELWFGATGGGSGGVGSRVFDVNIEGQLVEDNLDVFALAGANSPLVRIHTVTVTGGNLDIDFSSLVAVGGTRHPIINAIEIIGGEQSTSPPVADAGGDKTIMLPVNSATFNGTGNDPDGGAVSYMWSQQSGPNTATLSGESTANLGATNLTEGSYVFRLMVTDDEGETDFDETSVMVLPVPDTEDFALRINTGGSQAMYNGKEFIADAHFNTGRTLNRPQTGLSEPYKTFRYSRSRTMAYDIPLQDGEYTVKLHFAELWFGATGGGAGGVGRRVFDVNIEGQLVEDNLDVFAEVGAQAALVKTHTITVTGGNLDIDFSSLAAVGGTRHPIINAIEVLSMTSETASGKYAGFNKLVDSNTAKLSPNPATTTATLSFEEPVQLMTIQIFDVTGRLIRTYTNTETLEGGVYTLDVKSIAPGTYFIKSQDVLGRFYQKQMIIKE